MLVVALAGLSAVGCSAQTSAVFQSHARARGGAAAPAEPVPTATDAVVGMPGDDVVAAPGWLRHGAAGRLERRRPRRDPGRPALVDAVLATDPDLAARIDAVLDVDRLADQRHRRRDRHRARTSAPSSSSSPSRPQDRGAHAVKSLVKEQIAGLPGLIGWSLPRRRDAALRQRASNSSSRIDDPVLGALQVRALLFRFGSDAYLVSFVAPEAEFEAAEAIFEAIAASLRFGV